MDSYNTLYQIEKFRGKQVSGKNIPVTGISIDDGTKDFVCALCELEEETSELDDNLQILKIELDTLKETF